MLAGFDFGEFIRQLAQHSQAENRPARAIRFRLGGSQIRIPVKSRHRATALRANLVDRRAPCFEVAAPIGRFGTETVGALVGPGTVSLSSGLAKAFRITEGVSLRAEATFTNVLNHTNLADPILDVTQSDFGKITSSRGSDFGGNRTGQISLKLIF